ncbi:MAG: type II toxin-antitoxin system RelB/DinJ family antitoxin [Ruminococcus flavefaciens]|nr:type II toxin-antitoxin system RelB/DinJ family antitoxin [Ruminococcus flavefaciens]
MSKTANVFTRVDPVVKEQAEAVLSQLGISMSTAMGMFLQQLVLQRGIPFDVKIPQTKPVALGSLTDDEFNLLMDGAVRSAATGKCVPFEEFDTDIRRELGI